MPSALLGQWGLGHSGAIGGPDFSPQQENIYLVRCIELKYPVDCVPEGEFYDRIHKWHCMEFRLNFVFQEK